MVYLPSIAALIYLSNYLLLNKAISIIYHLIKKHVHVYLGPFHFYLPFSHYRRQICLLSIMDNYTTVHVYLTMILSIGKIHDQINAFTDQAVSISWYWCKWKAWPILPWETSFPGHVRPVSQSDVVSCFCFAANTK